MVRSMTGFGRAHVESATYLVRAQVRSVNNRSIKVIVRTPERLAGLDSHIERIVREHAARGTIQVNISLSETGAELAYAVDEAVLGLYHNRLAELRDRLGIAGEITLDVLLDLPGVVRKDAESDEVPEELRQMTEEAVRQALAELMRMREDEGRFIWQDIAARTELIDKMLAKVETRVPQMLAEYRERLTQRLGQLLSSHPEGLRPEEVHREIALFTDRSDITEEILRMRSHLAQAREVATNGEPVGRKIEFILQEMFREANTMGSKANDSGMIHDIVAIKSEIEKLREQAFNVE